ncbi:MAG: hypothetical protein LBI48_09590 [Burkholderiaceae bacterium]|nr:hypothetical protein [Burkholderiaceae bacterium]
MESLNKPDSAKAAARPRNHNPTGEIVRRWSGRRFQGLSEVSAKIAQSEYCKKFPAHEVQIEKCGWKLGNDKPAWEVVVKTTPATIVTSNTDLDHENRKSENSIASQNCQTTLGWIS